ncbi:hypothetical protein HUE58_03735 [Candidatus Ruthia endofausta]|uniref:Uncharacterized protein n=1 Tax=Candidatus Ruthia endofausta TaxID=2738852 RepID=A0A6N0HPN4_9GAMM|nr:hypothetical protein [Candidatus Ruthia endofausta]QKQ24257.1 hypothetical protein HUE58_03735 [Candidatus Ruthia endofausta]
MSSTVDNSDVRGNILMLSTLVVTLVLPLALIILSYIGIISGTAEYVSAFAVIASMIYIVGGTIWMFTQDSKDGEQLSDG